MKKALELEEHRSSRKMIPMFYPYVPESAGQKVAEILKGRWIGQGPKVDEFEGEWVAKFGLKYAVSLYSATAGIRLALALAGVGPGDEVLTTSQTCAATNTPILEQYAKPVFADVQYETANLDPGDLEHRVTAKTKALICVHWGGYPCDVDEIRRVASDHDLPVIEDAAHAMGAEYKGRPIGAISEYTVFSLQAIKHITTGDGGVLAVVDEDKYKAAVRRRWYGIDRAGRKQSVLGHDPDYDIVELGYKYHMNDIAATIGIEQLKHFDRVFKRREEIARVYREELEGTKGVTLFESKSDRRGANWLFSMHVERRNKFAEAMVSRGVEVSVVHWRNDKYKIFGGLRKDLPQTARVTESMISIPLHQNLTDDDVKYIVQSVKKGW